MTRPELTIRREEIEYPAGGGGIYSKTSDYALLLQYLLKHYLSLSDSSVPAPSNKILSDESVKSIFVGTLSPSALNGLAKMYKGYWSLPDDHPGFKDGEVDWSTAVAVYQPNDGQRREGWGRLAGSAGWGGAAGTEYWMDPKCGIAVSHGLVQAHTAVLMDRLSLLLRCFQAGAPQSPTQRRRLRRQSTIS
jgi:methyl acetate hydrolase